jgi:hypothetical protein
MTPVHIVRAYFAKMNVRKTTRVSAILFAAFALLLFSTVVVSDFDCHNAADDARCPYCHLNHQAPALPEITKAVSLPEPIAFLPVPEDIAPVAGPVFFQTAPRAPPV